MITVVWHLQSSPTSPTADNPRKHVVMLPVLMFDALGSRRALSRQDLGSWFRIFGPTSTIASWHLPWPSSSDYHQQQYKCLQSWKSLNSAGKEDVLVQLQPMLFLSTTHRWERHRSVPWEFLGLYTTTTWHVSSATWHVSSATWHISSATRHFSVCDLIIIIIMVISRNSSSSSNSNSSL